MGSEGKEVLRGGKIRFESEEVKDLQEKWGDKNYQLFDGDFCVQGVECRLAGLWTLSEHKEEEQEEKE